MFRRVPWSWFYRRPIWHTGAKIPPTNVAKLVTFMFGTLKWKWSGSGSVSHLHCNKGCGKVLSIHPVCLVKLLLMISNHRRFNSSLSINFRGYRKTPDRSISFVLISCVGRVCATNAHQVYWTISGTDPRSFCGYKILGSPAVRNFHKISTEGFFQTSWWYLLFL